MELFRNLSTGNLVEASQLKNCKNKFYSIVGNGVKINTPDIDCCEGCVALEDDSWVVFEDVSGVTTITVYRHGLHGIFEYVNPVIE